MNRTAQARWAGDLKTGKGNIKLGSGAYEGPYSFGARFEDAKGTNPEELLGAAHAGCYSMALGLALQTAGHVAESIDTTATVSLEKGDAGFSITKIHLNTQVKAPGISAADFARLAEETKKGCIISRALATVPMELTATLL